MSVQTCAYLGRHLQPQGCSIPADSELYHSESGLVTWTQCHFSSLPLPTVLLSTLIYDLSVSRDLLMVLLAVEF